jgi:LmbE family N-acetylglucosaminyl deacetylase
VLDATATSGANLLYLLRNLSSTGDVLQLGAHPDDEDGGLIAYVAHHHGARTVYWSATRGESGQNRVGPYLGEELGVFRTWEALAARRIDGGESIYGPFIDYGYSKNGGEALEKWGEQDLVREIVRAIRSVQPEIVIARWRGDVSDGHGHHAAVGAAAKDAFTAAGDPARFPELERVGLVPWDPRGLYQLMTGDWQPGEHVVPGADRPELDVPGYLRLNTGVYDPLAHLTYEEQASLAFNQYLSQATGSVPRPGDYFRYLRLVHPSRDGGTPGDIFDGFDRTLTSLADYPGGGSEALRAELDALNRLGNDLVDAFRPGEPRESAPALMELVERFRGLVASAGSFGLSPPAQAALTRYLGRKLRTAEIAAARCLGLRLEATVDAARLAPGDTIRLSSRLWSFGREAPADVELRPELRLAGAAATRVDDGGEAGAAEHEIAIPQDAPLTCPYWLRAPWSQYRYEWPEEPFVGEPFDPPLLVVSCTARVAGRELELREPAALRETFLGGARELGISILPPISINPEEHAHVLRERDVEQVLDLRVNVLGHHTSTPIVGTLEIHVPGGWKVEPERIEISLERTGDGDSFPVRVTIPAGARAGVYEIRYVIDSFGRRYDAAMDSIRQAAPGIGGEPDEGTCVREQFVARSAAVTVDLIETNVHEGLRYAYVAAPGDVLPELLQSLAFSVHPLTDEEVMLDLGAYDAVVVGPNAYLSRDVMRKAAARLLQYVHDGGTLIVQYQGYPFADMGATPYPFRFHEPHDRVSHENRPVRLVAPDQFLLSFPNRIGDRDFEGWVRDRGMYFFGEWDERYQPLLGCADPEEDEKLGGLLVASYGRGTYVYCAYTLFRQLAAAVPGAFRLFCNVLAAPEGRALEEIGHLRSAPLFESLESDALHAVAKIAEERRLRDGEYLCREGEPGQELYILLQGTLDVLQGDPEQRIATSGPGEPIGELAALTHVKRTASLRAAGDVSVLVVDGGAFRALLREQPEVSDRMLELLAGRLAEKEQE